MDIFEKYLNDNKGKKCRALTCKSYNEVYKKLYHKELRAKEKNCELATYGYALLNLTLCGILLDKCDELSVKKQDYESDKFLIEKIAKHYNLLDYINFDRYNPQIPQEYMYYENDNTKYIATTVEAVLGALFQETGDLKAIREVVESWIKQFGNDRGEQQ